MFICKSVLTKEACRELVTRLKEWKPGHTNLDVSHKNNFEIQDHEIGSEVYFEILAHPMVKKYFFIKHLSVPRFNKYEVGGKYAAHVDFFRQSSLGAGLTTDLSMTLFLVEPETYAGGELIIGSVPVKLAAGDMVVYPSGQIHEVMPVASGTRIAAIAWAESYISDESERGILRPLIDLMEDPQIKKDDQVKLSFVYNNLLRKWSR